MEFSDRVRPPSLLGFYDGSPFKSNMVCLGDATMIHQRLNEREISISQCVPSPDLVARLWSANTPNLSKPICLPWQRQTPPHTRPVAPCNPLFSCSSKT